MLKNEIEDLNRLICLEAKFLDEKEWDSWLSLYHEDAILWAPSWINNEDQANNPENSISLIYLENKDKFTEKVNKVLDKTSPSSNPLPRTNHVLGLPIVDKINSHSSIDDVAFSVFCPWISSVYFQKKMKAIYYSGSYEYEIHFEHGNYLIKKKIIKLMNDDIHSMLDFYFI